MDYISTKKAAEYLGVSVSRVLILIKQGRLKAEKISGVWIIPTGDLIDFSKQPRPVGWQPGRSRK